MTVQGLSAADQQVRPCCEVNGRRGRGRIELICRKAKSKNRSRDRRAYCVGGMSLCWSKSGRATPGPIRGRCRKLLSMNTLVELDVQTLHDAEAEMCFL